MSKKPKISEFHLRRRNHLYYLRKFQHHHKKRRNPKNLLKVISKLPISMTNSICHKGKKYTNQINLWTIYLLQSTIISIIQNMIWLFQSIRYNKLILKRHLKWLIQIYMCSNIRMMRLCLHQMIQVRKC